MKKRHPLRFRLVVWVFVLMVVGGGLFLARSSFVEPFEVPSESMLPTLRIGDLVWVDKTAYGISWPWDGEIQKNLPSRGDVAVFFHPDTKEYFVKRVIALPGERVMVLGVRVWVNGQPLETFSADPDEREMNYWDPIWRTTTTIRWAKNPEGASYRLLLSKEKTAWRLSGYWVVPEDHVFVLGDYRDESSDSRSWGFVHKNALVGKLVCVIDGGDRTGMMPLPQRTRCDPDAPVE